MKYTSKKVCYLSPKLQGPCPMGFSFLFCFQKISFIKRLSTFRYMNKYQKYTKKVYQYSLPYLQ